MNSEVCLHLRFPTLSYRPVACVQCVCAARHSCTVQNQLCSLPVLRSSPFSRLPHHFLHDMQQLCRAPSRRPWRTMKVLQSDRIEQQVTCRRCHRTPPPCRRTFTAAATVGSAAMQQQSVAGMFWETVQKLRYTCCC